jgi:hypothetical protein|tara:strand:- start:483 stop:755 length:273 start_codon:yes stop_codon:yes gene_type:complete
MFVIPTPEQKKEMLSDVIAKIAIGIPVAISDASSSSFSVCIGDLRDVGWAVKNVWRDGMNWTYTGPNSIIVGDKVIHTNEQTEEFEMDWS